MGTLHIVQLVLGGLPDTPFVTATEATAKAEYDRLMKEQEGEVDPEDGHGEEVDIYWWEVLPDQHEQEQGERLASAWSKDA